MADTLLLNADGSPISIVPLSALVWTESITLEWLDRANVVEHYENWVVRSPSVTMHVPAVMMLHKYVPVSRTVKFSRYNVFLRDNFRCQYCNADFSNRPHTLTIDHVDPRHIGGTTHWLNVVACCQDCNVEKAHHQTMMPAKHPYHPNYYEMVEKRKKFPIAIPHPSWADWLGWDKSLIAIKR